MSGAYYNEFDPGAAAWLRELIQRGLIALGEVDERSILDVSADDLRGFTQCHFFAGIGGWSYALRLAGWPDDMPVWTGSPPCQPFSSAGAQKGKDDERHLAPHFAALVADVRPAILFGEQVASASVFGTATKKAGRAVTGEPEWAWLDDLFGRLEDAHYACGASDIPAAGVGAPHIRQRTFFGAVRLADAECKQSYGRRAGQEVSEPGTLQRTERLRDVIGLADAVRSGQPRQGQVGRSCDTEAQRDREEHRTLNDSRSGGMANDQRPNTPHGGWADADWLYCRDGKWRPVESGTFPLAHGVSARVGRLRGYGNAIVPQAAAAFITSFTEAIE